jgi:hypothetical protein
MLLSWILRAQTGLLKPAAHGRYDITEVVKFLFVSKSYNELFR